MYPVLNATTPDARYVQYNPQARQSNDLLLRPSTAMHVLVEAVVMTTLGHLTRQGLIAATLLASPLFSQTDPSRTADFNTTSRASDHRDDGFNMGWLGLIGLAGLAGLRRKSSVPVAHTAGDGSAARVYPSKA